MNRPSLSLIVFGLLLGVSLIVSTVIAVQGIEYVKTFNNSQIDVTGSSKRVVTSDQVKWVAQFSRTTPAADLSDGYEAMFEDLESILTELEASGFSRDELVISPVNAFPIYRECNFQVVSDCVREIVSYELNQSLTLNSERVDDVTAIAQDVRPFIAKGINFSTQSLEYYTSQLPALRVELLGEAIEDAQARAEEIAERTGVQVGPLQAVDSGVFQVTQPNSTEVSGYGLYDTSTIDKEISAVVHARFSLRR